MNRIITSMLFSMVALSALSQAQNEKPTLVVGIIIDQLRSDYIELLEAHFGRNGFNRLIRDGVYFENVDFRMPQLDATSGSAILMTGSYPNINGISGDKIYNLKKRFPEKILTDPSKIGNFTNETFSPANLSVSTIGDEVRIDSNGLGYLYSISPDAQQAIILAGHAGNGAVWLNDVNGQWATSTYYKDLPQIVSFKNYNNPLSARLDTMSWTPLMSLDKYPNIPTHRKYYPFKYTFSGGNKDRYREFKQSAKVNEEVTSLAIDYLKTLALGKRGQLDMLNISYTAAPYQYGSDKDSRIELQDTYLRLDRQLERLFETIEKTSGWQNTVVFIASTGYFDDNRKDDEKFNIPSGEFYPNRAISLLNMYLIAKYGNGNWIDGYYDNQFFINKDLIKAKNLDLAEIRKQVSDFLRKMSGVIRAYTIEEIINNPVAEEAKDINRGLALSTAGDVIIEVAPGWSIVDNTNTSTQTTKQIRSNMVNTPIFILAPEIKPQKINSVVDATILAPTVSRILRIRSPNGAISKPVIL